MNRFKIEFKDINGFKSVADFFDISPAELWLMFVKRKEDNYTTFDILKKNGSLRKIYTPKPNVMDIQKKLSNYLTNVYRPISTAHGFVKNKSIKSNACKHLNQKSILNVDLKNFFETITFPRVRAMFVHYFGFNYSDATTFANIVCHPNGFLPQGAPTSPIISNIICNKLDRELRDFAQIHNCVYTRYADDISISFKKSTFPYVIANKDLRGEINLSDDIKNIIADNGFVINEDKTHLANSYEKMQVTGIKINSKLNIDKRYIRRIRSIIWTIEKNIDDLNVAREIFREKYHSRRTENNGSPEMFNALKSMINYIGFIKGKDDAVFLKLAQRYNMVIHKTSSGEKIFIEKTIEEIQQFNTYVVDSDCEVNYSIEGSPGSFFYEQGTAFFLQGIGIITNAHLFLELKEVFKYYQNIVFEEYSITIHNSRYSSQQLKAKIKVLDFSKDIAILEVENNSMLEKGYQYSENITKEMPITLLGYPEYKNNTELRMEKGKILGERYTLDGFLRMEITSSIYGGNSGGPIVNQMNEVIAVAVKGTTTDGRVPNEVIPIKDVIELHKKSLGTEFYLGGKVERN